MRAYFCLICLVVSSLAFSQPPRKVVKTKSRYLVEQYEVLSAGDTVRVGTYRRYFRDDKALLEEGQYADNKRTGVWTFYDGKGKPELVYDYSNNKVLANNNTTFDSVGVIHQDGEDIGVVLQPPPICLVSSYQIIGILARESRFPIGLQRSGVTQLSYRVAATVSPMGAHYRVIPSVNDNEFSKNAKQAVLMAFDGVRWLPGQYKGQAVTAVYLLPAVMLRAFSVMR